jgi:hypothetical protein
MIDEIRRKIELGEYEFSKHAVDQMILRDIAVNEVRDVLCDAQVIEDYPDDKYGPSCLLFGRTQQNRAIHVQCSYPARPLLKIVTVYEPDPAEWIDFKVRKK